MMKQLARQFMWRRRSIVLCAAATALAALLASRGRAENPSDVLGGRRDQPADTLPAGGSVTSPGDTAPMPDSPLLGPVFSSLTSGISFKAPADCKEIKTARADEIVRFVNDAKKWALVVSTENFKQAQPLANFKEMTPRVDIGHEGEMVEVERPGLLKQLGDRLYADFPQNEIFQQDIINVQSHDVGRLVAKIKVGSDFCLNQQAMVAARSRPAVNAVPGSEKASHYYHFNMTVTAGSADLQSDPAVKEAVETFGAVVDSVRMLDQSAIKQDQDERLYRTRSLFVNLTAARLRQTIVPETFLMIQKDGKPLGYSMIVERVGKDLPGKQTANAPNPNKMGGEDGLVIGGRSRSTPAPGVTVDAESWSYCTFDRSTESWAGFALTKNATQSNPGDKNSGDKKGTQYVGESGASSMRDRVVPLTAVEAMQQNQPGDPDAKAPAKGGNPGVRILSEYTLEVLPNVKDASPLKIDLPPWYIPQPISQMLPRLVAPYAGKTYAFAVYVPERQQVMMRYVDVLRPTTVTFNGQNLEAIQVRDRIGLEGGVTTHYISADGRYTYLGSENKESKMVVFPTDRDTLLRIFQGANLEKPSEVKQ